VKSDIGWIIIVVFAISAAFLAGVIIRHNVDFRLGYIECLLDTQNNKPMKYVLKKQANGETIWVENKEQGK
jgi:hypothetical protein